MTKMKQNIYVLKENHLIQQDQIKEQYELLNLTRVEPAEKRKLLKKLDRELLQVNSSFTTLSRQMIILQLLWQKLYFNYATDKS